MKAKDGAKNAPTPRPNKKPRLESEGKHKPEAKSDNVLKKDKAAGVKEMRKKDEALHEFMQVMQPRTRKERTWANDVADAQSQRGKPGRVESEEDQSGEAQMEEDIVEEVDDLEWMRRRMKKGLRDAESTKAFIQDDEGDSDSKPTVENEAHVSCKNLSVIQWAELVDFRWKPKAKFRKRKKTRTHLLPRSFRQADFFFVISRIHVRKRIWRNSSYNLEQFTR